MKSLFFAVAASAFAATWADDAFRVDFSDPSHVGRRDVAWKLDGAFARSAVTNGVRTLSLAPWPGGARPFRLSFKARGRGLATRGGHWGFGYRTADGCRFFTWTNPNGGFIYEITDAKKAKLASGSGGRRSLDWTGKAKAWTEIALEADSRGYVFTMDGEAKAPAGERFHGTAVQMALANDSDKDLSAIMARSVSGRRKLP